MFQAGDYPVFELRGVNTSKQTASVSFRIQMTGSAPVERVSRVMRMPAPLWQEVSSVTLQAGETRTFEFATKTRLPANQSITVLLQELSPDWIKMTSSTPTVGQPIPLVVLGPGENLPAPVVMTFSTAINAPTPHLASVK